jgi:hypothetical protein
MVQSRFPQLNAVPEGIGPFNLRGKVQGAKSVEQRAKSKEVKQGGSRMVRSQL